MRHNAQSAIQTIAAICTGTGGAISIIRVSGPSAFEVLRGIFTSAESVLKNPRTMVLGKLRDGGEPLLVVAMPNPNSYTGEDVFEVQSHGGMMNSRYILQKILGTQKVRQAEPGEFTLRAFINGKLDLTQAEAVADLIQSQSEMARQSAEHQLSGALRARIQSLRDLYYGLLAECESQLDFPEDVPDAVDYTQLALQSESAFHELKTIYDTRREGRIFRDGIRVALAGAPNVGKSSLLNRFLGYDRAIVSNIPGTTRDTVEDVAQIRGIPVCLTDTAGIRLTDDPIEKMGVARSESSIQLSQIIFWLLDPTADTSVSVAEFQARQAACPAGVQMIPCWNKCDVQSPPETLPDALRISVKTGEGVDALLDRFEACVWQFKHTEAPEVAVSERHAEELRCAIEAAESIPSLFRQAAHGDFLELAATQLHRVLDALGNITGETVDPDILNSIFSRFCIGK